MRFILRKGAAIAILTAASYTSAQAVIITFDGFPGCAQGLAEPLEAIRQQLLEAAVVNFTTLRQRPFPDIVNQIIRGPI